MDIRCPECGSEDLKPDDARAYYTCNKCGYTFSKQCGYCFSKIRTVVLSEKQVSQN